MSPLNQLKTMPDEQIQEWLRKVGKENLHALIVALPGADEEVKQCVFRNMSPRAVAQLKIDLEKQTHLGIQSAEIEQCATLLENLMIQS